MHPERSNRATHRQIDGLRRVSRDLRPLDILVARNIAFQLFAAGATQLSSVAAVYYKRVLFSEAEVGGVVAFRR